MAGLDRSGRRRIASPSERRLYFAEGRGEAKAFASVSAAARPRDDP
jgi:hypothetical protein